MARRSEKAGDRRTNGAKVGEGRRPSDKGERAVVDGHVGSRRTDARGSRPPGCPTSHASPMLVHRRDRLRSGPQCGMPTPAAPRVASAASGSQTSCPASARARAAQGGRVRGRGLWKHGQAWASMARHGQAWAGMARHGQAWPGVPSNRGPLTCTRQSYSALRARTL